MFEAGLSAIVIAGVVSYLLAIWGFLPIANVEIPVLIRLLMLFFSPLAVPTYLKLVDFKARRKGIMLVLVSIVISVSAIYVLLSGEVITEEELANIGRVIKEAIPLSIAIVLVAVIIVRHVRGSKTSEVTEQSNASVEEEEDYQEHTVEETDQTVVLLPSRGSLGNYVPATVAIRFDGGCDGFDGNLMGVKYREISIGKWKEIDVDKINPRDELLRWERDDERCFLLVARPRGYVASLLYEKDHHSPDLELGFYKVDITIEDVYAGLLEIECEFVVRRQRGSVTANPKKEVSLVG